MKQQQQETLMRNTNSEFEWTDDTIRALRQLWSEGHSTAEIGRRMGISKNAVVGKSHRLDLPARPSPIRTGRLATSAACTAPAAHLGTRGANRCAHGSYNEAASTCAGVPGARREAINASGALNRPRRNPSGRTASMASSFSDGSTRRYISVVRTSAWPSHRATLRMSRVA